MFGLTKTEANTINAAAHVVVIDKPAAPIILRPGPQPMKAEPLGVEIDEYAAIAASIGLGVPDVQINGFLRFMEKHNLPLYSLAEVVPYMDSIAKRDGLGYGWEWRPVRAKDQFTHMRFGTPASRRSEFDDASSADTPASDYYAGTSSAEIWRMGGSPRVYDKKIPLHAIKRIATIEQGYTEHKPHFFVSDYATKPEARPDPFLLVVLDGVPTDIGRFVVDFWDEPGFGIEQMLAK